MAYNNYKNWKPRQNFQQKQSIIPQQSGIIVTAKPKSDDQVDDQVIFIDGLNPEDGKIITNEINNNKDKYNCGGTFPYLRKFNKIGIHVKPSLFDGDTYKKGLFNKIAFILASSQNEKYDGNDIATLYDQVEAARSRVGGSIIDAASAGLESALDAWKVYSEHMNDPEFIKMMNICRMATHTDDSNYGHVYSVRNAMIAMSYARLYNKDISFLKTRDAWYTEYNRLIKKTARPIPMTGPSPVSEKGKGSDGNDLTQSVIDDILYSRGHDELVGKDWLQLPSQIRDIVNIDAKQLGYGGWCVFQYYDISDTELIPGAEDKFNDEIGLKSNLTGELNDKAKFREIQFKGDRTEEEVNEEHEKNALKSVEELCQKHNIIFQPNPNNPTVYNFGEGLYKLYNETFAKEKAIKPQNRQKVAGAGVNITVIITGIGFKIMRLYGQPMKVDDPELLSLMNNVWQTCQYILKRNSVNKNANSLNESEDGIMSKDEFKQKFFAACKQLGIQRDDSQQNIQPLGNNQNVEMPQQIAAESTVGRKIKVSESQLKMIIRESLNIKK